MKKRTFSFKEAREMGQRLGIDFSVIDIEQFRQGLGVEQEHSQDKETDVTGGNEDVVGKIAWAHLKEIRDYYTRLAKMEAEAEGETAS